MSKEDRIYIIRRLISALENFEHEHPMPARKQDRPEGLLAEIYDSTGGKLNGACPVCGIYTHKGWCWYPRLLEFLGKPMDEHDKAHLELERSCMHERGGRK